MASWLVARSPRGCRHCTCFTSMAPSLGSLRWHALWKRVKSVVDDPNSILYCAFVSLVAFVVQLVAVPRRNNGLPYYTDLYDTKLRMGLHSVYYRSSLAAFVTSGGSLLLDGILDAALRHKTMDRRARSIWFARLLLSLSTLVCGSCFLAQTFAPRGSDLLDRVVDYFLITWTCYVLVWINAMYFIICVTDRYFFPPPVVLSTSVITNTYIVMRYFIYVGQGGAALFAVFTYFSWATFVLWALMYLVWMYRLAAKYMFGGAVDVNTMELKDFSTALYALPSSVVALGKTMGMAAAGRMDQNFLLCTGETMAMVRLVPPPTAPYVGALGPQTPFEPICLPPSHTSSDRTPAPGDLHVHSGQRADGDHPWLPRTRGGHSV